MTLTGDLDSGLRPNDGEGMELAVVAGVGGIWRFPLTQPSPAGRGLVLGGLNGGTICNRPTRPTVIPAQAGIQNPGNGRHTTSTFAAGGGWIPAFAGMTVRAGMTD